MEMLKQYNAQLTDALQKMDAAGFENIENFEFNTSCLQDFVDRDTASKCHLWNSFWKGYHSISQPVVYWFTINSDTDRQAILAEMVDYKNKNQRSVPAVKTRFTTWDTNTLYVGCCAKTKFRDRIHQHFGYYVEGRTQGLQLCHWAKRLSLDIKLNFFQLPVEASDLTTLYEKKLAESLQPLFGKHK